jgi:N-acetylglucosamine-6-phosphate deacetylase
MCTSGKDSLFDGRAEAMKIVVRAARLLTGDAIMEDPIVEVDDGHIASIRAREGYAASSSAAVLDFPGALLAPAYLEIHVHGNAGHDVMEGTRQAFSAIEESLAGYGVGAFLPTTVTSPVEETLQALDRLAGEIEHPAAVRGAVPLGIHLEGPFLSHAKRGVHPDALLEQPSIPLFERFWQASRGHIRLMTIAPELSHAPELIEYASARGVRCSLGHSDATASQAAAGFRAGARSATHTFNAMRRIGHRDPGVAGYVLDNDGLFAEIICDGIHVDPVMIRMFFKAKGPARSILVTDGIGATGMPDGKYRLGGLEIDKRAGRCTLHSADGPDGAAEGGVLAGSVLTLDQAVRNFAAFTGSDLTACVALATRNPAKLLGIDDRWGALEKGREANFVALSAAGDVLQAFRAGRPILHR